MEKIWATLTRNYANSRQFQPVNELKTAIQDAWEGLETQTNFGERS